MMFQRMLLPTGERMREEGGGSASILPNGITSARAGVSPVMWPQTRRATVKDGLPGHQWRVGLAPRMPPALRLKPAHRPSRAVTYAPLKGGVPHARRRSAERPRARALARGRVITSAVTHIMDSPRQCRTVYSPSPRSGASCIASGFQTVAKTDWIR
jgi:hypothetical protein